MAGYLETLGSQATVETMYESLDEQVTELIDGLYAQRIEGLDTGCPDTRVPYTDLKIGNAITHSNFRRGSGYDDEGQPAGGQYNATFITADVGSTFHLISRMVYIHPNIFGRQPKNIGAYSRPRLSPDYSLTRAGDLIVAHRAIAHAEDEGTDNQPFGKVSLQASEKLARLNPRQHRLLDLVGIQIVENMEAINKIAEGERASEVLRSMGRLPVNS